MLIFSSIVFVSYLAFIIIKYGVQKSISASVYCLPKKYRFVFTLVLWSFAVPVMIEGNTLLMFLAGSGICFVGAASDFMSLKMTKQVHMIAAFSGIILGMASMWIDFDLGWIPIVMFFGIIGLLITVKNYIWWIEVLAFGLIILGLAL